MLATEDMCVFDAMIRDGGLVNDFRWNCLWNGDIIPIT